MMKNTRPEEENIIRDIRNLFRLKKETKAIRDRILRDIKYLFENEEENYYNSVSVNNFWSKNILNMKVTVIEIKLSVVEYLNKTRPYLKDIINDLKKSDTWKNQVAIANNFISSIDNVEEHVMHSKSDNIEIMISDKADEVIKELFDSLKNRY